MVDASLDYILHDVRVQVQLLMGNVDWMMSAAQGGPVVAGTTDVTDGLTSLRQNAQIIHRLLDTMLAPDPRELGPVDVSPLLSRVFAAIEHNAKALGKRCLCDVEGELFALGTQSRLERVVYNLLSNALRHAKGGAGIALRAWKDEGGVHIAVSNEGVALDSCQRCVLEGQDGFEDCERVQGMGLKIVRVLTDEMRGAVRVERDGDRNVVILTYRPCETYPADEAGA